jgi:hypothetical protein
MPKDDLVRLWHMLDAAREANLLPLIATLEELALSGPGEDG